MLILCSTDVSTSDWGSNWPAYSMNKAYLISMGMSANDDRPGPARNQAGNVLADDGFPKHRASKDVTDRAIGWTPHLLQLELLHALFIRSDGGALNAHVVSLHCLSCVNGHLVIGGITVFNSKVKTFTINGKKEKAQAFNWLCAGSIHLHFLQIFYCLFLWQWRIY